ncbi:MAG: hypothetical protein MESAZ_02494 [Saezia sanguinis]
MKWLGFNDNILRHIANFENQFNLFDKSNYILLICKAVKKLILT